MGLPIYLTEFTVFGGTITQKSSKLPFSAEFSDFGKTENSLESVTRTLQNIFAKIFEDYRRLPKTFEKDPKMFRSYTNELSRI